MPREIAIYLNLLYFRADTGRFFSRTSATFLSILLVMLQLVMGIINWNNQNNGNRHIYQNQIN
jgi:hypothetical protein